MTVETMHHTLVCSCKSCFIIGLEASSYPLPFIGQGARAWLPDTSLISSALLFFRDPFAIAVFYGFLALQVGARVIENDFGTTQSNPEPTVTLELSSGKRSRFTLALHRRLKKRSQHAPGRNYGLECCESSIANFPSFSRAAHRTIMVRVAAASS